MAHEITSGLYAINGQREKDICQSEYFVRLLSREIQQNHSKTERF
jgi:hypothetical protein